MFIRYNSGLMITPEEASLIRIVDDLTDFYY